MATHNAVVTIRDMLVISLAIDATIRTTGRGLVCLADVVAALGRHSVRVSAADLAARVGRAGRVVDGVGYYAVVRVVDALIASFVRFPRVRLEAYVAGVRAAVAAAEAAHRQVTPHIVVTPAPVVDAVFEEVVEPVVPADDIRVVALVATARYVLTARAVNVCLAYARQIAADSSYPTTWADEWVELAAQFAAV